MKRERTNWGAMNVMCLGFLVLLANAGASQVSNVDLDLQEIYEHFEGVSLAEAVQQLRPARSLFPSSPNDVIVQFNGGGIDNRLYVGRKNTLEVLITNDLVLRGFTLGLQLECDNCSFEWVEGYGTLPETDTLKPVHEIVRVEEPGIEYWIQPIGISQDTSSILLGGADGSGGYLELPQNSTELLVYSMQVYIPESTQEDPDGFHIDNIFFPPAGTWTFAPAPPDSAICPDYQGQTNNSQSDPSASRVTFAIVDGLCYEEPLRNQQIVAPRKPLPHSVASFEDLPDLRIGQDGSRLLMVYIEFDGDESDLQALGARVHPKITPHGSSSSFVGAEFPLRLLPRVSLTPGVKRVFTVGSLEYKNR
ncbi:MAG: hypothetical protein ABIJ61_13175 [bacterium]